MVVRQPSKLVTWVRFPSPAPHPIIGSDVQGEGPDEGPLDEPGGPPLPVDDVWNPAGARENYKQQQLNENLRRGGRGCMVPWIMVGSMTLISIVALAGR